MFGRHKESPPFTKLSIDRPFFDLSSHPWVSHAPLEHQLGNRPYTGEGFLFHATTEQLREALAVLTQGWEEAQFIQDIEHYTEKVHKDDMRKDDETPYVHHLLRGAIRIAQMDKASANMVAAYLLHDTVEDHNISLQDMQEDDYLKKYAGSGKLEMHHEIATALSMKRGDVKLPKEEFYANIHAINQKYPDLRVWTLKGVDRDDNTKSDLSFAVRHGNHRTTAEKIQKYRKKTYEVIHNLQETEPTSPSFHLLRDSWTLGGQLMKKHGLMDDPEIGRKTRRLLPRAALVFIAPRAQV